MLSNVIMNAFMYFEVIPYTFWVEVQVDTVVIDEKTSTRVQMH